MRRFSQRLLAANLFVFSVVLAVGGVAVGLLLNTFLERDFAEQKTYRVEKMAQQLDTELDLMDRLSLSIAASGQVREVFLSLPDNPAQDYFLSHLEVTRQLRDTLFSFTAMKPLTGRIVLVSRYFDLVDLSNRQDTFSFSKTRLSEVVRGRQGLLAGEHKVFLPPGQEPWATQEAPVVSLVRALSDTDVTYGWVEVNRRMETLDWIWAGNGGAFEAIALENAGRELFVRGTQPPGARRFQKNLQTTGWRLVLFADPSQYLVPLRMTFFILFLCLLATFLVAGGFSWVALGRITRPVRRLTAEVRGVTGWDKPWRFQAPRAPEEVIVLGEAFGDLLALLGQEHEARLRSQSHEASARMAAIQAQLNPHFIFNTLLCIGAYGKKGDGSTVYQMCRDLSNQLRYTLESTSRPATLGQELDQAEAYLALMGKRFTSQFQYSVTREDFLKGVAVPRLLLQPLLENAFVHGFGEIKGSWRVDVSCWVKGDRWEVEVKDNGTGLTPERLTSLRDELRLLADRSTILERDFSEGKLGLTSTLVRLQLLYGDDALFAVDSSFGKWFSVRLGGPHGL